MKNIEQKPCNSTDDDDCPLKECMIMKLNNVQKIHEDCREKHGFICQTDKNAV